MILDLKVVEYYKKGCDTGDDDCGIVIENCMGIR